ncbi:MAG: choice-of-anchor D domain-containing protein [Bradymonadia bacterium]
MRSRTFLLPLLLVLHACGGDGSGGGGDPADTAVTDAAPPADSGPVGGMSSDVGPGADAARTASLAIEPVEVDLGRVGLGQEAETTVLLRNTGDADLTVTTFAGLQTPFASSRMPPLPIGAGQTRMLAIQFSPEAAGPVEQVVTFETEPPLEAAATLTLRGEGISAEATLVTEVVDFGVVAPGEPTSRPLQLRNDSVDTALQITGLEGLMAPFEVPNGQVPREVSGGQTGQVIVQFAPAAAGDFEQNVVLRTTAGDFNVTLRGRAIVRGDLVVEAVSPAWAPTDRETVIEVTGGPFEAVPRAILVGEVALESLERVDAGRVRGTRPAGGAATRTIEDLVDVRVEVGASFGILTDAFTLTPPVAEATPIEAAALTAANEDPRPLGVEGNPWQLALGAVPEGQVLTLGPGAVVVVPEGGGLQVDGVLTADGTAGQIVWAPEATNGTWAGLTFGPVMPTSALRKVVLERAGTDGAAIISSQALELTGVRILDAQGGGVRVDGTGTLVLISSRIEGAQGPAVELASGEATIFRFQNNDIRRAGLAFVGAPHQFGRPLGAGNVLQENAENALVVRGLAVGDADLGNQPVGLPYLLGIADAALSVPRGATLELGAAVVGALGGVLDLESQTTLPAGLALDARGGASVRIRGPLTVGGTAEAPVTLGGEVQWDGVQLEGGGRLEGGHLQVQGGPVRLGANVPAFEGLSVTAGGDALLIEADATLESLRVEGGALVVRGGVGRLAGVATGEVRFEAPGACADWDLTELLDGAGAPVSPICP